MANSGAHESFESYLLGPDQLSSEQLGPEQLGPEQLSSDQIWFSPLKSYRSE
jgi:hypothetical protein